MFHSYGGGSFLGNKSSGCPGTQNPVRPHALRYTISVLNKLFAGSGRGYVTRKELYDLARRLQKVPAGQSPDSSGAQANFHSRRLVKFLLTKFTRQRKIPQEEIISAGDSYLHARGYTLAARPRCPVSGRQIYASRPGTCYDEAYYTPERRDGANPPMVGGHHRGALFYHRYETRGTTRVLGNFQIDALPTGPDAGLKKIILWRKHLYRTMVHLAAHSARREGAERIIFQAGGGAAWAQWNGEVVIEKKTITARNIFYHYQHYLMQRAHFALLRPGINSLLSPRLTGGLPHSELMAGNHNYAPGWKFIVDRKTPEICAGYLISPDDLSAGLMNQTINYLRARATPVGAVKWDSQYKQSLAARNEFWYSLSLENPEKTFRALENFMRAVAPNFIPPDPPAQRRWLTNYPWVKPYFRDPESIIRCVASVDDYFVRFNYHQAILQACPDLKIFPQAQPGKYIFIDQKNSPQLTLARANIRRPRLGDCYQLQGLKTESGAYRFLPPGRAQVYFWYERAIPKILTELGLKFKKVIIPDAPAPSATGWEVTSGWEEFAQRPLVLF